MERVVDWPFGRQRELLHIISKSIRLVYKQQKQQLCPVQLSHVRSIQVLTHLLPNKPISNQIRTSQIQELLQLQHPFSHSFEALSQLIGSATAASQLPLHIYEIADTLLQYRISTTSTLPFKLKSFISWNLSSLHTSTLSSMRKQSLIYRYLKKGPVLLQETKWREEDQIAFSTRWPGVQIICTNAEGQSPHLKAGVAILLPPGWQLVETRILVPHYAIAALVTVFEQSLWLVSWYSRPDARITEAQFFSHQLETLTEAPKVIGADINRLDEKFVYEWPNILQTHVLTDIDPTLPTYLHSGGSSNLDRVLISSDLLNTNKIECHLRTRAPTFGYGHLIVEGHLKHIPKLARHPSSVKHNVIPTHAFLGTISANEDEIKRHQQNLAMLLRQLTSLPIYQATQMQDQHSVPSLEGSEHQNLIPSLEGLGRWFAELRTITNAPNPIALHAIHAVSAPIHVLQVKSVLWNWWRTIKHFRMPTSLFKRLFKQIQLGVSRVQIKEYVLDQLRVQSCVPELSCINDFPEQNGVRLVPTPFIVKALSVLEHIQTSALASPTPRQAQSPILSAIAQRQLWDRLRSVCPKGAFHSGPIYNAQNEICTTAVSYDLAMIDTRKFWFTPPVEEDPDWIPSLQAYQGTKPSWPKITPPTDQEYLSQIQHTKDSATGPDGIPYAAWRSFPDITVSLLQKDFQWLCTDRAPPPEQVGVWIPKAQLGNTADYFRPLGMADTLDRLQDGAIAAKLFLSTRDWFHPAQTLLNHFREPQAAVQQVQEALDQQSPTLGIFLDLSKAFERINPRWILCILSLIQAPLWVIVVLRRLLFGRFIRHKVQGYLLPKRKVFSGVDMGRSSSVFLFCLAMDPIFTYLNQIPRVQLVSGYVDDTTIVGQGTFATGEHDWLHSLMTNLSKWETAGILMDKHKCWKIGLLHSINFAVMTLIQRRQFDRHVTEPEVGFDSFFAAVAHCDHAGPVLVIRGEYGFACLAHDLALMAAQGHPLVLQLAAQSCPCKVKTVVIPNYTIHAAEGATLDKSGLGAHSVQDRTISLGLHVWAAGKLSTQVRTLPPPPEMSFDLRFKKQLAKLELRLKALPKGVHSIRVRILYFNTYCLSLFFYAQSVHFSTKKQLAPLYNVLSSFILQRAWWPYEHLVGIMRWLKIGPLLDPFLMQVTSILGLFHRQGSTITKTEHKRTPLTQIEEAALSAWKAILKLLTDQDKRALLSIESVAQSPSKLAHAFNDKLKKATLVNMITSAGVHFHNRRKQSSWSQSPNSEFCNWLANQPLSIIGAVPRYTILRWSLSEDNDLWLPVRGQFHRTAQCVRCGLIGNKFPRGPQFGVLCQQCCPDEAIWYPLYIDDVSQRKYIEWTGRTPPTFSQDKHIALEEVDAYHTDFPPELCQPCVACGGGVNSIDHWCQFCPVLPLVLNCFYPVDTPWVSSCLGKPITTAAGVLLTYAIFHLRRLARQKRALDKHPCPQPPMSLITAVKHVASEVWSSLSQVTAAQLTKPVFETQSSCLTSQSVKEYRLAHLHIDAALLPKRGLVLTTSFADNTVLARVHTKSHLLQYIFNRPADFPYPTSQVRLRMQQCDCGDTHIEIVACGAASAQSFLVLSPLPYASAILIQFDGSAHRKEQTGGAGVVTLQATGSSLSLTNWSAIALPKCVDNLYAEAHACYFALRKIEDLVTQLSNANQPVPQIILQGDILPLITFLQYRGRLRKLDILPVMQECKKILAYLPYIQLSYLPRECNKLADFFAGVASKLASVNLGLSPVEVPTAPPYLLLQQLGFALASDAFDTAIEVSYIERPTLPAPLLSKLLTKFPDWTNRVAAYLALHRQANCNRLIHYRPTSNNTSGRLYALAPSGQLLKREFRLAFFGTTHFELDLIHAHYEILRRLAPEAHLTATPTIREWLLTKQVEYQLLGFADFHKRWPTHILNMPNIQEVNRSLTKWGYPDLPSDLYRFAYHLLQVRDATLRHPPAWAPTILQRLARNSPFRFFENIERMLVQEMLTFLQSQVVFDSIILLHDGAWVCPAPPNSLIQQVDHHVAQKFCLYDPNFPLFRCDPLLRKYQALTEELRDVQGGPMPPSMQPTLYQYFPNRFQRMRTIPQPSNNDRTSQQTRLAKRQRRV